MFRRPLQLLWLVAPVLAMAWHYGPGQGSLARDEADLLIRSAEAAAVKGDWEMAAGLYAQAITHLPADDQAARQRLRLEQARARALAGELVDALDELDSLLGAVEPDSPLATVVRHELAVCNYHAAWLMRLEGAAPDEWKPAAEQARQCFRLLAERAVRAGTDAEAHLRNLEATIRLEQMDLSALLAKPPPKNCPKCCRSLSQRKRKQSQSRCEGEGQKQEQMAQKNRGPDDVRKEIKKVNSAGIHERSGSGS
jgi:hypothetical protein